MMKKIRVIIIWGILYQIVLAYSEKCVPNVAKDPNSVLTLVSANFHKLKPTFFIDEIYHIEHIYINRYRVLTEQLLPSLARHMTETFAVREDSSKLIVPMDIVKCGKAAIPKVLRSGISSDLIVIFTADTKYDDPTASGSICLQHSTTNRPIVISMNLNVAKMTIENSNTQHYFNELLREIYTNMAFSSKLYPCFIRRVDSGNADDLNFERIPISETLSQISIQLKNGKIDNKWFLVAPNIREATKKHYNCPTIQGMLIEDGVNPDGTIVLNRFEFRIAGNELMSGALLPDAVVSEITLAFFRDSGWYEISDTMAEILLWGKNEGCDILSPDSCPGNLTCNARSEYGCSFDSNFKAKCGSNAQSNSCSFLIGTNTKTDDCRRGDAIKIDEIPSFGQSYGVRSKCFIGKQDLGFSTASSFCYEYKCSTVELKDGRKEPLLTLRVGEKDFECKTGAGGSKLAINKSQPLDFILCPEPEQFCSLPSTKCSNNCMMNGRCLANGKCWCLEGFLGESCELRSSKIHIEDGRSTYCPNDCYGKGRCILGECKCDQTGTYSLIDRYCGRIQ